MSKNWCWYSIQVKSGCEKRCVQAINQSLAMYNLQNLVESIVIPTEKVEEVRRGKKTVIEKKFLPGYILIKACMDEKLCHIVSKVRDVIKFLDSNDNPNPLKEEEVERIFSQMRDGTNISSAIIFNIGEYVQVIDGPFESFSGIIEGIDESKQRLKILVTILGKETPVDLGFDQVSKEISKK